MPWPTRIRPIVNVWGTSNWARQTDKRHRLFEALEALPDWDVVVPTLPGRICRLRFDSDAWSRTNPHVAYALWRLASWLAKHGALVGSIRLPDLPDGTIGTQSSPQA